MVLDLTGVKVNVPGVAALACTLLVEVVLLAKLSLQFSSTPVREFVELIGFVLLPFVLIALPNMLRRAAQVPLPVSGPVLAFSFAGIVGMFGALAGGVHGGALFLFFGISIQLVCALVNFLVSRNEV